MLGTTCKIWKCDFEHQDFPNWCFLSSYCDTFPSSGSSAGETCLWYLYPFHREKEDKGPLKRTIGKIPECLAIRQRRDGQEGLIKFNWRTL